MIPQIAILLAVVASYLLAANSRQNDRIEEILANPFNPMPDAPDEDNGVNEEEMVAKAAAGGLSL